MRRGLITWKNNYLASDITSEYRLNRIYSPEIREPRRRGDFHIHDLYVLSAYCVGWDFKTLLRDGFRGVEGKVESRPSNNLYTGILSI